MTSFGDNIYCKTINGKAPTDHGIINFETVLENSDPVGSAGGKDITNVSNLTTAKLSATELQGDLNMHGNKITSDMDSNMKIFFGGTPGSADYDKIEGVSTLKASDISCTILTPEITGWKQFTYSQNTQTTPPGSEVTLPDGVYTLYATFQPDSPSTFSDQTITLNIPKNPYGSNASPHSFFFWSDDDFGFPPDNQVEFWCTSSNDKFYLHRKWTSNFTHDSYCRLHWGFTFT
jgi:hypothetical protein